jgi:acyl-ACP thioesterase
VYLGEEKLIGCETFWAVMNTKTRRPEALALPHQHFEKFPDDRATNQSFSKIDMGTERSVVAYRTVQLSDLDIVNHANNVKYLEWCLDEVDVAKIMSGKLQSFEMNFMKEVALGEELLIEKNSSKDQMVYSITSAGKSCFALELDF